MQSDATKPTMPISHRRLLEALLEPVLDAGRLQLALREKGIRTEFKADRSVVTAADQQSEKLLLAALDRLAPGIAVVAEEASAGGEVPKIGSTFFLVDPLDGTREYVAGGGDFTINIALVIDGVPRFGLIYAPVSGDLYATTADDQAVRATIDAGAAAASFASVATMPISTRTPVPGALVAVMSRSFHSPQDDAFAAEHSVTERRSIGSSLKFCMVARGEADVYPRFGSISEWDTAAGHAIVNAAGGAVLAPDGCALKYGKALENFINPSFVAWGRAPRVDRAP